MHITNQFEAIGDATKTLMDHFVLPHLETGKIDSNTKVKIYNMIYGEISQLIQGIQREYIIDKSNSSHLR